jgi:hypothetical protein
VTPLLHKAALALCACASGQTLLILLAFLRGQPHAPPVTFLAPRSDAVAAVTFVVAAMLLLLSSLILTTSLLAVASLCNHAVRELRAPWRRPDTEPPEQRDAHVGP